MTDDRPNPDELLSRVQQEEHRAARGRLKIFFGAAPGVGKTYAMLEAARKEARDGVDVVVGYVEPHVRPETQALVLGLDVLPRREVEYRGRRFFEFDLQQAIDRRPQILVVDELAHTNVPAESGAAVFHAKRWQDVEQVLAAGIDVYTTINVQHLESLNDVVARITGVTVRETIPDEVFESADEVEFVDLPPDDLLERLKEGKVYVGEQAKRATENFFQKGNLIALRELALRRMAERVDTQMTEYRAAHSVERTWPVSERLLVCVGPSPKSADLVRATRRMAASLKAVWVAVHVETPTDAGLTAEDRHRLAQTMNLAEQLGAETVTLSAGNVARELVDYARRRNVTKIIIGKPQLTFWKERIRGSFVSEIVRKCGEIDVYVISGESAPARLISGRVPTVPSTRPYLGALLVVALCTLVSWLLSRRFEPANLVMVYLVGVVVTALRLGRGPSILASLLGVAVFDFCFVPPYLTFAVEDTQYLFTFGVMLVTGLVISTLTTQVSFQAEAARNREARTAALYSLTRDLLNVSTLEDLALSVRRHLEEISHGDVLVLVAPTAPRSADASILGTPLPQGTALGEHEMAVAEWVLRHGQPAGRGTETLPSSNALFLPLATSRGVVGVLGVRPRGALRHYSPDETRLLEMFAAQIALAVEHLQSLDEAQQHKVQLETERLRNSLLSAVSHDLRTPLAAITGASSTLLSAGESLSAEARRELAGSIDSEAGRLNRLVANLLDMTRLEAGALRLECEWYSFAEIVGGVLQSLARSLKGRAVSTDIPADLPLVYVDELLIHQVLMNLLENAHKHSPAGIPLEIHARMSDRQLSFEVADRGPGFAADEAEKLFSKFYRSVTSGVRTGAGLGLAICKGIVELHRGSIRAENRAGGGSVFRVVLPQPADVPHVPLERSPVAIETFLPKSSDVR